MCFKFVILLAWVPSSFSPLRLLQITATLLLSQKCQTVSTIYTCMLSLQWSYYTKTLLIRLKTILMFCEYFHCVTLNIDSMWAGKTKVLVLVPPVKSRHSCWGIWDITEDKRWAIVFIFNELSCHTCESLMIQDGQPFTARMSGMLKIEAWGAFRIENEM